jgi:MinD superfamily P-loop ATPase
VYVETLQCNVAGKCGQACTFVAHIFIISYANCNACNICFGNVIGRDHLGWLSRVAGLMNIKLDIGFMWLSIGSCERSK